jgi:hypothetical protein
MIPLAQVTKSLSNTSAQASDTSLSGSVSNIYDGNNGTSILWYVHHGGDGSVDGYLDFQCTWVKPKTIYNVYGNGTAHMDGGNYFTDRGSEFDFSTYLYYGGGWNTIAASGAIYNGKAGDGAQPYNWISNVSGQWDNVTGARFYMHVLSSSYEGNRQQFGWLYMNEFAVYREAYSEIFRVKRPSVTTRIGYRDTKSGSKMRVAKAGTIYELPLLDTDDPDASPVRVYTGSAVKALPLAD